jgi:hypothetical protein
MEKINSKIIILLCFALAIMQSCCKNNKQAIIVNNYCDSIIYELPEETTKQISDFISDKQTFFCYIISESAENQYHFNFPYIDKYCLSNRDSMLLSKTNIYLKIKDIYYPVIHDVDDMFSNIPRIGGCINDFNFCFVKVDARGNLISSFAY